MRFFYTPRWLQNWQSQYIWRIKTTQKRIFLTFDDGPIPEVTPFVLDTLAQFNAKATFFCVGDNIRKYPQIFHLVLKNGHAVGNHTYNHVNGWKVDDTTYLANIEMCTSYLPTDTSLFRPPYGKIKKTQLKAIAPSYKIIMWDVLTYDFDNTLEPETCLQKAKKHTKNGSIVVFHDSLKAEKNLRYVLPLYLEWAIQEGFTFSILPS